MLKSMINYANTFNNFYFLLSVTSLLLDWG